MGQDKKKPLFDKKVVITRSSEQAGEFSERLSELGAEPIECPVIKIVPCEDLSALDNAMENIDDYDWVIFTSVNGVEIFFDRLFNIGKDTRDLKGIKVCAVGPATKKRIESYHLNVDFQPRQFVAESVVEGLKKIENLEGKKFLLPRADIAREFLPETLSQAGAIVDDIKVYKTVPEDSLNGKVLEYLEAGQIDFVAFTSSSTFKNFVKLLGKEKWNNLKDKFKIASIGPITSKTIKEYGTDPTVEANEYTVPGLVDGIVEYFDK